MNFQGPTHELKWYMSFWRSHFQEMSSDEEKSLLPLPPHSTCMKFKDRSRTSEEMQGLFKAIWTLKKEEGIYSGNNGYLGNIWYAIPSPSNKGVFSFSNSWQNDSWWIFWTNGKWCLPNGKCNEVRQCCFESVERWTLCSPWMTNSLKDDKYSCSFKKKRKGTFV